MNTFNIYEVFNENTPVFRTKIEGIPELGKIFVNYKHFYLKIKDHFFFPTAEKSFFSQDDSKYVYYISTEGKIILGKQE